MFKFEILYGFPHLVNLFSKILFLSWSCFGFLSLETDAQRFRALRSGGFRSTKLSASTTLDTKHKAPSLHVTPPDAKPVL